MLEKLISVARTIRSTVGKPLYHQLGYKGKVDEISHFFGRPESFEKEISTFYEGVNKRLSIGDYTFESAFIFLATYEAFMPLKKRQEYDLLDEVGGGLLFRLRNMGHKITDIHDEEKELINLQSTVTDFKFALDSVIESIENGTIKIHPHPLLAKTVDTSTALKYLKIISQNPEEFIRRYAKMYGYTLPK